jgi:hypothetical protein
MMILTVVAVIAGLAMLTYAELDRQPVRPRRFGIGLRRSHLQGDVRRPWRWQLIALYTPDAIDVVVGTGRPTRLSGRTRTYVGAVHAARRARRHLEEELDRDRAELVARLRGWRTAHVPGPDGFLRPVRTDEVR